MLNFWISFIIARGPDLRRKSNLSPDYFLLGRWTRHSIPRAILHTIIYNMSLQSLDYYFCWIFEICYNGTRVLIWDGNLNYLQIISCSVDVVTRVETWKNEAPGKTSATTMSSVPTPSWKHFQIARKNNKNKEAHFSIKIARPNWYPIHKKFQRRNNLENDTVLFRFRLFRLLGCCAQRSIDMAFLATFAI